MTLLNRPTGSFVFAGQTYSVTTSPYASVVLLQPRSWADTVLPISIVQCSTSPLSFLKSALMSGWGLIQRNSVISASFNTTGLDISNAAAP